MCSMLVVPRRRFVRLLFEMMSRPRSGAETTALHNDTGGDELPDTGVINSLDDLTRPIYYEGGP